MSKNFAAPNTSITTTAASGIINSNISGLTMGTWKSSFEMPEGSTIRMDNGELIKLKEMVDVYLALRDRLFMLSPDFQKHELYPALADAYEQYRIIEKLVMKGRKEGED